MIPTRWDAYELMHRGTLALARCERVGLRIDTKYVADTKTSVDAEITALTAELRETEIGKVWTRLFPGKEKYTGEQAVAVFIDHLKLPVMGETEHGNPQLNEEALLSYRSRVDGIDTLLRLRKLNKISGTYFAQLLRETVDGYLHPHFHLHTVRTYRSSSTRPNFQNMPIRDPEAGKLVRSAIIPPDGFQIGEIDFKGLEVAVAACVTRDPQLIAYVSDPALDMHRDMSVECFKLDVKEVSKHVRHTAKNKFVFPQFYGDYYVTCATAIWDQARKDKTVSGTLLIDHLKAVGFTTYNKYERHIKAVEERFWGERFRVYSDWREERYEEYLTRAWFETVTGFRCSGLYRKNQICNYPVQGPAFHCLLYTLIETDKELRRRRMKTRLCGQIHDSMLAFIWPPERDLYFQIVLEIVEKRLPAFWDWIVVPLPVEIELCPVDSPWSEKKAFKVAA